MTEEEKQAALEAKQKAEAEAKAQDDEFEASIADLSDEEKEAKRAEKESKRKDSSLIDYAEKLKKEKEARERAEQALAQARFKADELKRKEKEEKGDDFGDEDKPVTARELKEILATVRQVTQKEFQAGRIAELVGQLAESDEEKALVIEIHTNRNFPSYLTLEQQVREAYVIANSKRLLDQRDEALRALRNKEGVNVNAAQSHREPLQGPEPKLAPDTKSIMSQKGFIFNPQTRRYEKKIGQGKVLIFDLTTKKVYPA